MTNVKVQRKNVPGEQEIQEEISQAQKLPSLFQRRRAEAIIALLETGKRRSEIASLKQEDLEITETSLIVRFTVRKKRKKNELILQRAKKYNINSPLAQAILRQLIFIRDKVPQTEFLFPMNKSYFGQSLKIFPKRHMEPQEVWRIVKRLNPQDWPHLHRERRASRVVLEDERKYGHATLETVFRIKRILDLEDERTAYRYISRFETQRVEDEEDEL